MFSVYFRKDLLICCRSPSRRSLKSSSVVEKLPEVPSVVEPAPAAAGSMSSQEIDNVSEDNVSEGNVSEDNVSDTAQ